MNEGLLSSEFPPELPVNENLLKDDAYTRQQDVFVSVLYVVFMVDTGFWFVTPTMLASCVYFLYANHAMPTPYWLVPLCGFGSIAILSFIVLLLTTTKYYHLVVTSLILWQLSLMPMIGMAAALMRTTAALQLCMVFACQSLAMVLATEMKREEIDLAFNGLLMCMSSILCIAVGMYAFILEHDFVSAVCITLISGLALVYKLYMCHIIKARGTFDASVESKIKALQTFYTFFIVK